MRRSVGGEDGKGAPAPEVYRSSGRIAMRNPRWNALGLLKKRHFLAMGKLTIGDAAIAIQHALNGRSFAMVGEFMR
jgi:hypothetical protein